MTREPDKDPANPVLAARFMVERADLAQAAADAQHLSAFAARFGALERLAVERYWKIPEWFEVALLLRAESGGRTAAFAALVAAFTPECMSIDDPDTPWAVWDARTDPPPVAEGMESVRWFTID